MARPRARGGAPPRHTRRAARAPGPLGDWRLPGRDRPLRARLVRAAARRAARRAHRHGHDPRAGRRGMPRVRDHPRGPAARLPPPEGAGALRMNIIQRSYQETHRRALVEAGIHPLLAKIYAARSIRSAAELAYSAAGLLPPTLLKGMEQAAALLADAIQTGKRLLIIADYDADGATACAVGMRALRLFGANVDYLVPDRFKLGYGLSPELTDIAGERKPDLLITVDNGIASVEGVARARAFGIGTLITDHHLPGAELPQADCLVNPNQMASTFPPK